MMIDWIWDAHIAAGGNLQGFIVGSMVTIAGLWILVVFIYNDFFRNKELSDEEFTEIVLNELDENNTK